METLDEVSVATPASAEEAGEVLAAGGTVLARGAGTKLDWGAPPRSVDVVVDTARLDRVVEHAAGDLVVVVQAGVRLEALQEVLAGAGQRLALDPPLSGTVGGMIATGLSGPRRLLHGGVRDQILGATLVRADGTVSRSGGKVVKNVAGYDLAKLACGSYGTLGLVTEAAFRLHPIPPAAAWVVVPAEDPHAAVQAALHGQFVPTAVEVDGGTVAVLLEGTEAGVKARTAQALAALGPDAEVADRPAWWGTLPDGEVLVRLTCSPGLFGRLHAAARGLGVPLRGSAGVGSLWAGLPADPGRVAEVVTRLRAGDWDGTVQVLRAPAEVRAAVDAWGPVAGLELMRRVKDGFDPQHRLSPGRFVGGI